MKVKSLSFLVLSIVCSSCELLPQPKLKVLTNAEQLREPICIWKDGENSQLNDCKVEYWIRYWGNIGEMSWSQRKNKIEKLSNQDSDTFKKILLSQTKGTPYQNRLRANIWTESLMPKLSQEMRRFLLVALYQPSLELLEMESALVTLSKSNTRREESIEQQTLQLNKQAQQIEQLLNIETSIIDGDQRNNK